MNTTNNARQRSAVEVLVADGWAWDGSQWVRPPAATLRTMGMVREHFNLPDATQLRAAAAEGGALDWLINDMEQTVASVESMWQEPADSDSSAQYEAGRQMAYMTLGNLLRDTLNEWKKKLPAYPPTDSGTPTLWWNGESTEGVAIGPTVSTRKSQWHDIPLYRHADSGAGRDGERFRWLMSEQADMVWAHGYDGKIRWSFYMDMPAPNIDDGYLGPGTVKAELIAAIDTAIAGAAGEGSGG